MMNSSSSTRLLLTSATKALASRGGRSCNNNNTLLLSSSSTILPLLQQQQQQVRTKKTKTGSRGSRGHGWYTLYRSDRGGRHLQGRYYDRNVSKLQDMNEEVFRLGSEFVYLDISVGGGGGGGDVVVEGGGGGGGEKGKKKVGRVVIELASAALPMTTLNFKQLCLANPPPPSKQTGENENENDTSSSSSSSSSSTEVGYLHTKAHLIDKTIGIAFGDVLHNNGISGKCHPSINPPQYFFGDEPKVLSHSSRGMVTMLSPSVECNDSRFLVQVVEDAPHLDGRYVAFGRVVGREGKKDGEDCGMDFLMEEVVKGVFTKRGRPTVDVKIVGCGVLDGFGDKKEEEEEEENGSAKAAA